AAEEVEDMDAFEAEADADRGLLGRVQRRACGGAGAADLGIDLARLARHGEAATLEVDAADHVVVGPADVEAVEEEDPAPPQRERDRGLVGQVDVDRVLGEVEPGPPELVGRGVSERADGCTGRAGDVGLAQVLRAAEPDGRREDAGDLLELGNGLALDPAGRLRVERGVVVHLRFTALTVTCRRRCVRPAPSPRRLGPVHSEARQRFVAWSAARIAASSGESSRIAAPVSATAWRPSSARAATRTRFRPCASTIATPSSPIRTASS